MEKERVHASRIKRFKKKRRRKWVLRITLLTLFLVLGVGGYYAYHFVSAVSDAHKPLDRTKSDLRDEVVSIDEPFTVLVLGIDAQGGEGNYRPDTMMLLSINPKNNTMKMLSIPRDTYVEIPNRNGGKDKINSVPAYAFRQGADPVQHLIETVEKFLNVPVDHYATINFKGFVEIVDAVGGVDVEVPFDFWEKRAGKNERIYFTKGPMHLNGEEALAYVRMRKRDKMGDLGRNMRQRQVLQDVASKMASFKNVSKIDDILQALGKNVAFDFNIKDLPSLQRLISNIPKENMESLELKGDDGNWRPGSGRTYYYYVHEPERQRISDILREHLELPPQYLDGREKPAETQSQTQNHQNLTQ